MKKIVPVKSESWLINYIECLPVPASQIEIYFLNRKLHEDYKARYVFNPGRGGWEVHFEDERDYMAMVLKWS